MAATVEELISLLQRFLRWWLGELAGLVPEGLRERLRRRADMLVALLGDQDAHLYLQTGRELKLLGRLDTRAETHPVQRLRTILQKHGLARAALHGKLAAGFRIPAQQAVRTIAELPLAAEENLNEVISFELDRHTPFSAERAVFSYRIIGRDVAARRLNVELIVVPRTTIDQVMELARRLEIEPDRIDVAERETNQSASRNLIPIDDAKASRGMSRLTYALAAMAAGLAITAIYLPVLAAHQRTNIEAQEFARLKASTVAAAALQKEIDAVRTEQSFLIDRKRRMPTVSKLLFDTTRILPDDTWLVDWQFTNGEVLLTGYARSASALVELLEQSHVFHNTTFRSPVTQDAHTERERFAISTQVIPEARP